MEPGALRSAGLAPLGARSPRERRLGGGWGRLPWERQALGIVQEPGSLLALRFERRFLRRFAAPQRGDTAERGRGGTWDTGGISVGNQITAQKRNAFKR